MKTPTALPKLSEADFQAKIINLAKWCGWRVFHPRPARYSDGRMATHYTGDAGFPDLVLCHPGRGVIFAELKADKGRISPAQEMWLDELLRAGSEAYLWRPADWPAIEHRLKGVTDPGVTA
jgi:hypothetical protein